MKRIVLFMISLSIGFSMISCSSAETEKLVEGMSVAEENSTSMEISVTEDITAVENIPEIDIYYFNKDSVSGQIVKAFEKECADISVNKVAYFSVEEMDEQIAADLENGNVPDVILFPTDTTTDTVKLAAEGAFMDLSSYMDADADYRKENYYPVLDAGRIGDRQLLMPLRFRCHYLLTSNEKLENVEFGLSQEYTMAELMEKLTENAQKCDEESSAMQIMYQSTVGGLLYDNLRLTGVEILDPVNAEHVVSPECFREYAEYTKMSYEQFVKSSVILKLYSRDFEGAFARLTTLNMNGSLPYNVRNYDAMFTEGLGESMTVLTLPGYDDKNEMIADVSLYAAVPEGCDVPEEAYRFIRFAMDAELGSVEDDLSVNRECVQSILEELSSRHGSTMRIGSKDVPVLKMDEELRQECEAILSRITSGDIRSAGLEDIFLETMEPYILDQAEYEECYSEFLNRLEMYW